MATVAMTVLLAPAAQAAEPRLEARAILPADASFPAPLLRDARQRLRREGQLALVHPAHRRQRARAVARQPVPARPHAEPRLAPTASRAWRSPSDGKTLYPFLEGPLVGDDPLVRHVYEFDVSERRYTGRNWIYRMSIPGTLVSDAVAYGRDQLIVTERDNGQGPAARLEEGVRHRRARTAARTSPSARSSTCSRQRQGRHLARTRSAPATSASATRSSSRTRPSRPCCRCPGNELAFVNDTNFGSTGRNPNLPDYSDFIIVKVPGIKG